MQVSAPVPSTCFRSRVLVIDDEPGFTHLLKAGLERFGGYEIACCHDSGNALDVAADLRPDIILLDIVMPGKDGTELYRELQEHPELRSVPTIMLTALVCSQDVSWEGYAICGGMLLLSKLAEIGKIHHCLSQVFDGRLRCGLGVN